MAVFWVFLVQYPSDLSFTCLFIEKYGTDGKTAVPGVVERLAEKNNKMRLKHACYSLGGNEHECELNTEQWKTCVV